MQEYPARRSGQDRLGRSTSEVIRPIASFPEHKKIVNHKFRRRSLVPKNVRIENEGFQETPSKPLQTVTELRFLADIIKRKQEPMMTVPVDEISTPKIVVEYQYYDSIVRNLISEIRSRSSKQQISAISASKMGKFNSTGPMRSKSLMKDKPQTIKLTPGKEKMTFSLSLSGSDTIYQRKITSFIQFLYKINFSNSLYVDLSLSKAKSQYRIRVGPGNNGALVKSLIKRRFWLQIVTSGECHFSWSQLTDPSAHDSQESTLNGIEHSKHNPTSKRSKLLTSSPSDQLQKILKKEEMAVTNQWYERSDYGKLSCHPLDEVKRVTNHIPLNCIIGAKRILFRVVDWYYREILEKEPWSVLPKTFSFEGDYRPTLKEFESEAKRDDKVWIVKPGQNTNRGKGIQVMQTRHVTSFLNREKGREGRPFIVQEYIKPFLYNGRKFDIRHFLLLTSVNGHIRAYWYKEGYLRTSSQKYDIEDLSDEMIHLTNDAVQKNGDRYGKYEPANKLSYSNFQRYLDTKYPHKHYNFQNQVIEKMKEITKDLVKASFQFMDPQRKQHNFQLYGLDFYISSKFKVYLIQCNANPCLEVNCPLLQKIIPGAVEHGLRIGLDPLLPPPCHYPPAARYHLCDRAVEKLKYELIFDEKIDGPSIRDKSRRCRPLDLRGTGLKPDEDVFEDDGSQLDEGANLD